MRRSVAVSIGLEGQRDAGKVFHITELFPEQFEGWLVRGMLGLTQAGVNLPPGMAGAGLAGLAVLTLHQLQSVPWGEMEPLMAAMLPSFSIAAPTGAAVRPIKLGDVEELETLWRLRVEWLELHLKPLGPASITLPGMSPEAPKADGNRAARRRSGRSHHAPGRA